jgi:hypothetical protein
MSPPIETSRSSRIRPREVPDKNLGKFPYKTSGSSR